MDELDAVIRVRACAAVVGVTGTISRVLLASSGKNKFSYALD